MQEFTVSTPDATVRAESKEKALQQVANAHRRSTQAFDVIDGEPVPEVTPPAVFLKFHPQRWVGKYAREAETRGQDYWYIPLTDALNDAGAIVEPNSHKSDRLKDHPTAPLWIQQWSGPYYVSIEKVVPPEDQSLKSYFETEVDNGDLDVTDCLPPGTEIETDSHE